MVARLYYVPMKILLIWNPDSERWRWPYCMCVIDFLFHWPITWRTPWIRFYIAVKQLCMNCRYFALVTVIRIFLKITNHLHFIRTFWKRWCLLKHTYFQVDPNCIIRHNFQNEYHLKLSPLLSSSSWLKKKSSFFCRRKRRRGRRGSSWIIFDKMCPNFKKYLSEPDVLNSSDIFTRSPSYLSIN